MGTPITGALVNNYGSYHPAIVFAGIMSRSGMIKDLGYSRSIIIDRFQTQKRATYYISIFEAR